MPTANSNTTVLDFISGKKDRVIQFSDGEWRSVPEQDNKLIVQLGGDDTLRTIATVGFDVRTGEYDHALALLSADGVDIVANETEYAVLGGSAHVTRHADGSYSVRNDGASMAALSAMILEFEDYSDRDKDGDFTVYVDRGAALADQEFLLTTLAPGQVLSARPHPQNSEPDDATNPLIALTSAEDLVLDRRGTLRLDGADVYYTPSFLHHNQSQTRVEIQISLAGEVLEEVELTAAEVVNRMTYSDAVNTAPVLSDASAANLYLNAGQSVDVAARDLLAPGSDAENDVLTLQNVSLSQGQGVTAGFDGTTVSVAAGAGAGSQDLAVSYRVSDGSATSPAVDGLISVTGGFAGASATPDIAMVMAHGGQGSGNDTGQDSEHSGHLGALTSLLPIGDGAADANGDGVPDIVLPTQQAKQSGDWFDPASWGGTAGDYSVIPTDAALVHIPAGITLDYDLGTPGQGSHYEGFLAHWAAEHADAVAGETESDLPPSVQAHFGGAGGFGHVPDLFIVRVDGGLSITAANGADTVMVVDTLLTAGGTGQSGLTIDADAPTDGTIDIAIKPLDTDLMADRLPAFYAEAGDYDDGAGVLGRYRWDPDQLSLGIVASGAVNILGQAKTHHLQAETAPGAGDSVIEFGTDLAAQGWAVGDVIVISTAKRHGDFRKEDYEHENEVLKITSFTADGEGVRFQRVEDGATRLKFDHNYDYLATARNGESIADFLGTHYGENGEHGDRRADFAIDVVNLSRNVNIRSWAATQQDDKVAQGATFGALDPDKSHWNTEQGHVMLFHTDAVTVSNAGFLGLGRTDKAIPLNDMAITQASTFQGDQGETVVNAVLTDIALMGQVIGILDAADPDWEVSSPGHIKGFMDEVPAGQTRTVRELMDALDPTGTYPVSRHFLESLKRGGEKIENFSLNFLDQRFDIDTPNAAEDLINPRGRYSLHIHRAGTELDPEPGAEGAEGAQLEGNVVWGSPGWGYTQHDSVADLTNNVSFNVAGSAFNTETGNERGTWTGNVAVQTTYPRVWASQNKEDDFSSEIHDFGFSGSAYWLEGHAVDLVDNVAIDSGTAGFWIATNGVLSQTLPIEQLGDVPDGLEQLVDDDGRLAAEEVPFLKFDGNRSVSTNYAIYWQGDNSLGTPEAARLESDLQHVISDFTSVAAEQYLIYAFSVANVKLTDPLSYGGYFRRPNGTYSDDDYVVAGATTSVNSQHKSSDFTVIGGKGNLSGSFFTHSGDAKGAHDYGHVIVVRDGGFEPNINPNLRAEIEEPLPDSGDLTGRVASFSFSRTSYDKVYYTNADGTEVSLEGADFAYQPGQNDNEQNVRLSGHLAQLPVSVLHEADGDILTGNFRVVLGSPSAASAYSLDSGSYSAQRGSGGTAYGFNFEARAADAYRKFVQSIESFLDLKDDFTDGSVDVTRLSMQAGDGPVLTHRQVMVQAADRYDDLVTAINAVDESYVFDFDPVSDTKLVLYGMVEDSLGATYTDFLGGTDGFDLRYGYTLSKAVLANAAATNGYFTLDTGGGVETHALFRDFFYDRYTGEGHEVTFTLRLDDTDAGALARFLGDAENLGAFGALTFDSAASAGALDDGLTASAGSAVIANFGNDTLTGSAGGDLLMGGDGDDTISDGAGVDVMVGGYGADLFVLAGDGAVDTIRDFDPGADVVDAMAFGATSLGALVLDHVADGVLEISHGAETLILRGDWAAGEDILTGDNFLVNNADGIVRGTSGKDRIDRNYIDTDGDLLTNEADTVEGGGDKDHIVDLDGADVLYGGDSNDRFDAGPGANAYYGGNGNDVVRYDRAPEAIVFDLADSSNSTGWAEGESYDKVETILGTRYADVFHASGNTYLRGGNGDDVFHDAAGLQKFRGDGGADTYVFHDDGGVRDHVQHFVKGQDLIDLTAFGITGMDDLSIWQRNSSTDAVVGFAGDSVQVKAMWDTGAGGHRFDAADFVFAVATPDIIGTEGRDTLAPGRADANGVVMTHAGHDVYGLGDKDHLTGGDGDDRLFGGAGNDNFRPSQGGDHYDGGANYDVLDYRPGSTEGIVLDLTDVSRNTGIAAGDSYAGIERFIGTNHADEITADARDRILGANGDDVLIDNSGGAERMSGGNGADTYVLVAGDGFTDRIEGFQIGQDKIDLSAWGIASFDDLEFVVQSTRNSILRFEAERLRIDGTWEGTETLLTADDFLLG